MNWYPHKSHWITILVLLCTSGLSQPLGYYSIAHSKAGDTLKHALHLILTNHTEYPYTSSSTDVWDILKESDIDPSNPSHVILIYSGGSIDAAQEYNNGNGWTREHVWAKSRGDFGTNPPAGTDAHHLKPADPGINSKRSNRNFDNCITCVPVLFNGTATGSFQDQNLWTFEPRDVVKGDVARMLFYMAVRYEGTNGEPDLELNDTIYGQSSKAPRHSVLSTLITWSRADTVDQFERNRNEVIYSYQNNRNPFIDHPELVEYLWGDSVGVVWNASTGIEADDDRGFILYPNPTSGYLTISSRAEIQTQEIEVMDIDGRAVTDKVAMSGSGRIVRLDCTALHPGMYAVRISMNNALVLQPVIIF